MRSFLGVTIAILLLVAAPKYTWCIGKVTVEGLQCNTNQSYITNITTSVVNSAVNLDLILIRPLPQGYKANVDVQLRLARGAKYQSLFTYDFDVCNVMHNVLQLKIMQKWYKKIIKYGNFMENCPILEGTYYLRNLTMDPSYIPSYLQVGAYRVVAHAYFGKYKTKNEKFVGECVVNLLMQ